MLKYVHGLGIEDVVAALNKYDGPIMSLYHRAQVAQRQILTEREKLLEVTE